MNEERQLTEREICRVAVAKLRTEGWRVVCEVPILYRSIDAAATRGDEVMAIEAKVSFTRKLRHQIYSANLCADFVLAVVGTKPLPKTIEWCEREGIGLWTVRDGQAAELCAPRQQKANGFYRSQLLERCAKLDENAEGGVPCVKGVGITQDVQRRVDAYRTANPKATWKEIFANVPSHYDNHKNMYSALRSNTVRLAIRARQRESQSGKQVKDESEIQTVARY